MSIDNGFKPQADQKLEDQKSWQGEIVVYTPESQDDFFEFGKTMWERDLERTWDPSERQRDLLDIPGNYQHDGGEFWLAKDEGKGVVGCAGLKPIEDTDTLEFVRYYVLSDMRGKKIGKELIHKAIHQAVESDKKSIILDTNSEKSKDAIRIFEVAGFKEISPYKPVDSSHQLPSDLFMKLDLTDYKCPFCKKQHGSGEIEETE